MGSNPSGADSDAVLTFDGDTLAGVAAQGGGLNGPWELAFGPGGDLFVASSGNSQVRRNDLASGAFVGAVGVPNPTFFAFAPAAVPGPGNLSLVGAVAIAGAVGRRVRRRR